MATFKENDSFLTKTEKKKKKRYSWHLTITHEKKSKLHRLSLK